MSPDVVFLDIEMPGLTGLQVAKTLQNEFKGVVVFITAFSHYAVSAFEVDAFNYLVKPINDDKFSLLLDKIYGAFNAGKSADFQLKSLTFLEENKYLTEKSKSHNYLQRISLRDGKEIRIIDVATIFYIESAGNYLGITNAEGTIIQRMTMKQIHSMVDPSEFIRCHRSHIINRRFIESMKVRDNTIFICTRDGKSHDVSRRYLKSVREFFKHWKKVNN